MKKFNKITENDLIQITSLENLNVKNAMQTAIGKNANFFSVDSFNLIQEAEKNHLLVEIYTSDINFLNTYTGKAKLYYVNEKIISKLSSSVSPQAVIGICKVFNVQITKRNKIVLLENIQDPGNVGTIIRTAKALNYDSVILLGNCANPFNHKVINSSQGAIFSMPILKLNSVKELKQQFDNEITSTVVNNLNAITLNNFKPSEKFIIAFGNESKGISKELQDNSKHLITIPINDIDSINVSQAAAIIMYNLIK